MAIKILILLVRVQDGTGVTNEQLRLKSTALLKVTAFHIVSIIATYVPVTPGTRLIFGGGVRRCRYGSEILEKLMN